MRDPPFSQTHLRRARWILETERRRDDARGIAAAAALVYDHLHLHLDPLLGGSGVQLLLLRSARLAGPTARFLADPAVLDSATKLRECLEGEHAANAEEGAAAVYAAFLGLLSGFIGERLVFEVLRKAWPKLGLSEPPENAE